MALTETNVIDSINITITGIVEVRTANIVMRDDIEIARNYHRHTLSPNSDLTGQDERVAAIATAAWAFSPQ